MLSCGWPRGVYLVVGGLGCVLSCGWPRGVYLVVGGLGVCA